MLKTIIVKFLISCLLLTSCTSWETVKSPEPNSTIKITTNEDKTYEMSKLTEEPEYFKGFAGETKREGNSTIKYTTTVYKSDIKILEEQQYDGNKTLWFSIIAVVGVFAIMLATFDFSFKTIQK